MDTIDIRGLTDEQIDALIWRKRGHVQHADNAPLFLEIWRRYHPIPLDCPTPFSEYQFAKEAMGRNWAFDWAFAAEKLAVEVDGGFFAAGGGRHSTDKDREKMNAAAALGWRVMHFSKKQLTDDPLGVVEIVMKALEYSK